MHSTTQNYLGNSTSHKGDPGELNIEGFPIQNLSNFSNSEKNINLSFPQQKLLEETSSLPSISIKISNEVLATGLSNGTPNTMSDMSTPPTLPRPPNPLDETLG